MLEGIVPDSALKVKSKCFSEVMSPMVDGIVPDNKLVPITKFVMLWKNPISDGSDPDKPRFTKLIDATLPKFEESETLPHVTP